MNGSSEQVQAQLIDKELIKQFKEEEQMDEQDKHLVKIFFDAFIYIIKKKI